jgi:hypothetical protein
MAITEGLAGWVPQVLANLDSVYDCPQAAMHDFLPRKPSDYFRTNCFIGASFMSRTEADARYEIGVDRMMWGADYPHAEGTWPYSLTSLRKATADVPRAELELILAKNASACYGFDLDLLAPIAEHVGPTERDLRVPPDDMNIPFTCAFRETGGWS